MTQEELLEEFSRMNNELINTKRELLRLNRELEESSRIDPLTGLRNRRAFDELADQHHKVAARGGGSFAVLYFDLDDFKSVNDRFGHAEGDAALKAAAGILASCFRAGDILARIGGDEFIALQANTKPGSVDTLTGRIRAAARNWNETSGKPWSIRFSIGGAEFDTATCESLAELIARADEAMYRDKRGRSRKPDELDGADRPG